MAWSEGMSRGWAAGWGRSKVLGPVRVSSVQGVDGGTTQGGGHGGSSVGLGVKGKTIRGDRCGGLCGQREMDKASGDRAAMEIRGTGLRVRALDGCGDDIGNAQ
jgi:hypothetical protein